MNALAHLLPLIQTHTLRFQQDGIITVRPGYRTANNWPTQQPAIVVIVSKTAPPLTLPREIDGLPVEVRTATVLEELTHDEPGTVAALAVQRPEFRNDAFPALTNGLDEADISALAVEVAAAKPQIAYTAPAGASLSPVTGKLTITCHTSPDAGWPTLRTFLAKTTGTLMVGLYDFTSKHILDAVEGSLLGTKKLEIVLDSPPNNPTADQTDEQTIDSLTTELSPNFASAWALVRSNPIIPQWIYPNAYHIKVAVRDSSAMWLSSGNWNNSNQPDMDPIGHPLPTDQALAKKSDRDWHVVIEHPGLAKTYEAFLKHDFAVASQQQGGGPGILAAGPNVAVPLALQVVTPGTFLFHAPLRLENVQMTITPLLTPDAGVYLTAMLNLLDSAQSKLYIQLQYIHPPRVSDELTTLIDKVIAKIGAGVDVRIILSQWQLSSGWLERLQAAGVSLNNVRIQNGVHNKGFVVDSKKVVLGSQNWSSDGVLRNRDASVIIDNRKAAQYYEKIFLHDWNRLAVQSLTLTTPPSQ